ncbi:ATP-grasp domain-containing protein, partial [Wolbachia endosymbiont of Pentidionis agamae]|uniref:ATP-grasp domain-containing protein n=1 Tax=Wolbachia endosymbiont of Pentidionis agamae TaxID=3110435 RepID=UPI002FD3810A
ISQLSSINWDKQYILEKRVDISKEISIVIARNSNNQISYFPIAENHHIDGILDTSTVPAKIDYTIADQIKHIAKKIACDLNLIGILAVEFFITKDDNLLVNELAPRPHNSCHWSLDACNVSQFEQLVRTMCGLPMQEVILNFPCMTKNILGCEIYN